MTFRCSPLAISATAVAMLLFTISLSKQSRAFLFSSPLQRQHPTTTTMATNKKIQKLFNRRLGKTKLSGIHSKELRFFSSSPSFATNGTSATTTPLPFLLENLDSNVDNVVSSLVQSFLFPKGKVDRKTTNSAFYFSSSSSSGKKQPQGPPSSDVDGPVIHLTKEEEDLFELLRNVVTFSSDDDNNKRRLLSRRTTTTLRVAGGWVRDKLLASEDYSSNTQTSEEVERLTSKFKGPSSGRQGTKLIGTEDVVLINPKEYCENVPVDIDVALNDMLGREFANYLNKFLIQNGMDKLSVGMVLQNPEKSKHLETATMKVGKFWVDFVNLRAEEYTNSNSRIPDLMRIGTAVEDAYRRDLTINSLFYNIHTRQVEDWTGRGLVHLRKKLIATPLPALTTLLDDPLRVLRSIRFAARLRFTMDESLRNAAMDERVRIALEQKVARERIGSEVDLMLRSQDPVGAMRLLVNLNLVNTVFPFDRTTITDDDNDDDDDGNTIFSKGLNLISTTHNHMAMMYGVNEIVLINDDDLRRKLWYASFLKPLRNHVQRNMRQHEKNQVSRRSGKKSKRSAIMKLMVDDLKRPLRDAESVELIMKAADDFTNLLDAGCDLSATTCLLGEIQVIYENNNVDTSAANDDDDDDRNINDKMNIICKMRNRVVDCNTEDDPVWLHAMEYRLLVSKVLSRVGTLWRAAVILSLSEQLLDLENDELSYTIEGDVFEESQEERRLGIIEKYDAFTASMLQLGLVGPHSSQEEKLLIDGRELKSEGVLPNIEHGPIFREIMDEQIRWMTTHPGGKKHNLVAHLREVYSEFL